MSNSMNGLKENLDKEGNKLRSQDEGNDLELKLSSDGVQRTESEDKPRDARNKNRSNARLLEDLTRVSEDYRLMKINILEEEDKLPDNEKNFKKAVSFDTVNIRDYSNSNNSFDESELFNNYLIRNDGVTARDRKNWDRSPSPGRKTNAFVSSEMSKLYQMSEVQYPTKPITRRDGSFQSAMHVDYLRLYKDELNDRKHGYSVPVLPGRIILVYISARRHTWVALDWVLNNLIENGDTILIVGSIGHKLFPSRYPGGPNVTAQTARMRLRERHRQEQITWTARRILKYALEVMKPSTIVKINVELVLGGTKLVLRDMCKLYEPNLICTGTKPNLRSSPPLRSWLSSRITDRIVKNFPCSLVIVPALNVNQFEREMIARIEKPYREFLSSRSGKPVVDPVEQSSPEERPKEEDAEDNAEFSDASSIDSEAELAESIPSNESFSSYDEISNLYDDYKETIHKSLFDLKKKKIDQNYFANQLTNVSDNSLYFCRELKTINPSMGEGRKLAHVITGSRNYDLSLYKTKSLLDPPISKESLNLSPSQTRRRNSHHKPIQNNSSTSEDYQTPPKQTSLKFAHTEHPKRSQNSDPNMLRKCVSDEDRIPKRPPLRPAKSHPLIFSSPLNDHDRKTTKKGEKKKRKRFFGLF